MGVTAMVTDTRVELAKKDGSGKASVYLMTYKCIPDTVDPRGPKGK